MLSILLLISESYHKDWTSRNEKTLLLDYELFYSFFRLINFSMCDITTLTPLLFGVEISLGSKLSFYGCSSAIYLFCLNENLFKANLAFCIFLLFTLPWFRTKTFLLFNGKLHFLILWLGFLVISAIKNFILFLWSDYSLNRFRYFWRTFFLLSRICKLLTNWTFGWCFKVSKEVCSWWTFKILLSNLSFLEVDPSFLVVLNHELHIYLSS